MHLYVAALSTAAAETAPDIAFPELPDPVPTFPTWASIIAIMLMLATAVTVLYAMRLARGRGVTVQHIINNDRRNTRLHRVLSIAMLTIMAIWTVCILYLDWPHMNRWIVGIAVALSITVLAEYTCMTIPALKRCDVLNR